MVLLERACWLGTTSELGLEIVPTRFLSEGGEKAEE